MIKSPQLIGLELGAHALKMVRIESQRRSNILTGAWRIPTGGAMDWRRADVKSPSFQALKADLVQRGLKGQDVCFSLPPEHTVLRWMDFEGIEEADWKDAAAHRLRKVMDENQAWEVAIGNEPDPVTHERLVTAMPRDLVFQYADAVAALGLNPVAAEPESTAILRIGGSVLRRRSPLLRDGAAVILDIGYQRTRIDMIRDDKIEFTREFRFGSHLLIKSIAKELVLTEEEAALTLEHSSAALSSRGWLQIPTPGGLAQIDANPHLQILVRETGRLVRYFRSIYPERSYAGTVASLLVTGGLAGLSGICEYVERALQIESCLVDPLSVVRIDLSEEQFILMSRAPYVFTVATGLALALRNRIGFEEESKPNGSKRVLARAA